MPDTGGCRNKIDVRSVSDLYRNSPAGIEIAGRVGRRLYSINFRHFQAPDAVEQPFVEAPFEGRPLMRSAGGNLVRLWCLPEHRRAAEKYQAHNDQSGVMEVRFHAAPLRGFLVRRPPA